MAALRKTPALALTVLVLGSVPAAAQLRPAPVDHIFKSYNDCFAATAGPVLAPAELEKLGWKRATITAKGKEIQDGPAIYGHADRAPIILLSEAGGRGACIVTARVASYAVFDEFTAAFGGKLPKPGKDGAISYSAQGRIVQIAPTGKRDEPAMRLVVMTPVESK